MSSRDYYLLESSDLDLLSQEEPTDEDLSGKNDPFWDEDAEPPGEKSPPPPALIPAMGHTFDAGPSELDCIYCHKNFWMHQRAPKPCVESGGSLRAVRMKSQRRYSEAFKTKILEELAGGKTLSELHREHDIGHPTISRWAKIAGVPVPNPYHKKGDIYREPVVEAYAAGMKVRDIISRWPVSSRTILRWAKDAGIARQRCHSLETRKRARALLSTGMSPGEVGDLLSISPETVKSWRTRSKATKK